jgi:GDP-L-fucose synthase
MKVLVTGGSGQLGKSLKRVAARDFPDLDMVFLSSADADLRDKGACEDVFQSGFDAVIHAAARVGGIQSNIDHPVEYLADNLLINTHVINAAFNAGVGNFIFIGSSCMYPKDYRQPLVETDVLAAPLEETNEGYALAKISGAKHCEYISRTTGRAYRTFVPCNLYGLDDHFDSEASHLVAAIVSKVGQAVRTGSDEIEIWGDGTARREFLFSDDLSSFILSNLANLKSLPQMLNLGYGEDCSVGDYYRIIADIAGFEGRFTYDTGRPAGMKQKLMDSSLAKTHGWSPLTNLHDGLRLTYARYQEISR